jgi:anti-sigma B factor antagonist
MAVEHDNGAAVVTVGGELEFGTAAALRHTLIDLAQKGCDPLVIDLEGLGFIDSSGLSLLVQAKQRIESQGHRFVLRNPSERVQRVFEISGLTELFGPDDAIA